jgi:16S rRNA (cytidine1402-2'-O)-methyltransferase
MSGLASEGFVFLGFSPAKSQQRQKRLAELSYEQKAMVFYEAPHRIIDMLADMHSVFGDRKVAVVKEVTKLHEEVLRGRISEVLADLAERTIAGEYVIVAEGASIVAARSVDEALGEVRLLMKKGKGRKEAVKMIASEYGLNKRELYERSLDGPDH